MSQDYSIAELDAGDSDCSAHKLNIGMSQTPPNTWDSFKLLEFHTPDVRVVSIGETSPTKKTNDITNDSKTTTPHNLTARKGTFGNLPSSTPVITIMLQEDSANGTNTQEPAPHKTELQDQPKGLFQRKSKNVFDLKCLQSKRVNLLLCGPPPTPMTPNIKEMLTPKNFEPNVVPLNTIHEGRPFFIIHPISGELLFSLNIF